MLEAQNKANETQKEVRVKWLRYVTSVKPNVGKFTPSVLNELLQIAVDHELAEDAKEKEFAKFLSDVSDFFIVIIMLLSIFSLS